MFVKAILQRLARVAGRAFDWRVSLKEKVHYHEYPVRDERGEIVGYEFFTTSSGSVSYVETAKKDSPTGDSDD
jgi:hypothetical protein